MALPFDVLDIIVQEEREPKLVRARNGPLAYWCHKAFGKDPNQDAQYLNTAANVFVSIDGMGGHARGDLAARVFAEQCQRAFKRNKKITSSIIRNIHSEVAEILEERDIEGGVCYLLFSVQGRTLHVYHAGDVKLVVLNQEGKNVFETEDHVENREDYFGKQRQVVTNCVGYERYGKVVFDSVPLQEGYRLIAASDGLWKFCPVQEVAELVRGKETLLALDTIATNAIQRRTPSGRGDNINLFLYDFLALS